MSCRISIPRIAMKEAQRDEAMQEPRAEPVHSSQKAPFKSECEESVAGTFTMEGFEPHGSGGGGCLWL